MPSKWSRSGREVLLEGWEGVGMGWVDLPGSPEC